jgi:hypothetical protein
VTQIAGGLVGRPPARQLVSRRGRTLASSESGTVRFCSRTKAATQASAQLVPARHSDPPAWQGTGTGAIDNVAEVVERLACRTGRRDCPKPLRP